MKAKVAPNVLLTVVDAGNDRGPGDELLVVKLFVRPFQIFEDSLVVDPGPFLVPFGIHVLDVVVHEIDVWQNLFEIFISHVALADALHAPPSRGS